MYSNVNPYNKWNWEGGAIVYNPIVKRTRNIIDTRQKYDIDIREFLARRDNAVLKNALKKIIDGLNEDERWFFISHEAGSFDFRVQKIQEYVTTNIKYQHQKRKQFDDWLFPEETIALGKGDCEDRSILLAALIIASGVSSYMVRVALGKLYIVDIDKSYDHVWVMYKNETGNWMLLESMLFIPGTPGPNKIPLTSNEIPEVEYIPYFLFNDDHMWQVEENTIDIDFNRYIIDQRDFWDKFNPGFFALVHNTIIDQALGELSFVKRLWIKLGSLAIDSAKSYDPREHSDDGYIMESWDYIDNKLREGTMKGLIYAVHDVADFYAHTTYPCFARRENSEQIKLFDRALNDNIFEERPEYGQGIIDLKNPRFTTNRFYCPTISNNNINFLNQKKIISGRYGQPRDSVQGIFEKFASYIPYVLRQKDFAWRYTLPHHDEIAVDKPLSKNGEIPGDHKLYLGQPKLYEEQFKLRVDAAIRHIKQIYRDWSEKNNKQGQEG